MIFIKSNDLQLTLLHTEVEHDPPLTIVFGIKHSAVTEKISYPYDAKFNSKRHRVICIDGESESK
jgi:hypothetical protein